MLGEANEEMTRVNGAPHAMDSACEVVEAAAHADGLCVEVHGLGRMGVQHRSSSRTTAPNHAAAGSLPNQSATSPMTRAKASTA